MKKLRMMAPMSARGAAVVPGSTSTLDWVIGLPWSDRTEDKLDVIEAEKILDEDHYGLKKVKERILEYLAGTATGAREEAQGAHPLPRGPTRRRQDLARALDREGDGPKLRPPLARRRARRGRDPRPPAHVHRRAAGQDHPVAQEGRHAEPRLPARREIDKDVEPISGAIAVGWRCSTEVLDPEGRTATFQQRSLPLDLDYRDHLRRRMFITTANYLQGIPIPLQDRMEGHPAPGLHRVRRKVSIAERYPHPQAESA